ncbi:MAG: PKD domain-containing protein, partial [Bacteroidia bacterium]|nr:PKD domain-containing protein [Bacteroidia bacterium]
MKPFSILSILFYLLLSFKTTTTTYAQWNDASVFVPQIPVPQPEFNLPCGIAGSPINITNNTANQPGYIYTWSFSDGSVEISDGTNPDISHTFESYGYYCVDLEVNTGCATAYTIKTIFVNPVQCACTTYNYPDQSNLGSGISGVTLTVEGDLFVTQNCTIQNSTLQFGPKGRLIVKKGKILTINQSLLTTLPTCNNYLWQGIEVWGYYNAPSDELNQGKIIIDNQTVIENAHIAVLLGARNIDYICDNSQTVFYNTASGGIINARANSTFNSNGINIKFTPKHPASLNAFTSEIKDCNFTGADLSAKDPLYVWSDILTCYPNATNPYAQASSGGRTYMGIYVEELKNVGGLNGFYNNAFSNMQYGIESANARFDINHCNFNNLGWGIFIHNYTSGINVNHSIYNQCFFDNIQYAIYIIGGKNDMIQNNKFGNELNPQANNNCGILAHSSSGFSILDNDFYYFKNGIRIMKSGSTGGFITNSITHYGNVFNYCRKSIETVSDNSALKIKCNR